MVDIAGNLTPLSFYDPHQKREMSIAEAKAKVWHLGLRLWMMQDMNRKQHPYVLVDSRDDYIKFLQGYIKDLEAQRLAANKRLKKMDALEACFWRYGDGVYIDHTAVQYMYRYLHDNKQERKEHIRLEESRYITRKLWSKWDKY